MAGILELIQKSTDSKNVKLLNQLALAREYFWTTVLENPIFKDVEIKIHNVVCEKCGKIITESEDCSCIKETVVLTAGRGKKQCKNKNCGNFLGPRTIICSYCGYNFKTGLMEVSFKKKEAIVKVSKNKKKKKCCIVKLGQVKSLDLLIENDMIEENIRLFKDHPDLNEDQRAAVDSYFEWRNQVWGDNKKLFDGLANLTYQALLRKNSIHHLKAEDLQQAAAIGGYKAIIHFDPSRRTDENECIQFSTYAHSWIRKEIWSEVLKKDKEIFVPIHIINKFKSFRNWYNQFVAKNEVEPGIQDIMKGLGHSEKVAEGLMVLKDLRQYQINSVEETTDKYKNDTSEDFTIHKTDLELTNKLSKEDEHHFDYLKYLQYCTWTKPEYREMFLDYFGLNDERIALSTDQLEEKYDVSTQTINNQIKKTLEHLRGLIEE